MTDKYHDTSGITNLRLSAEQGNLLSRFQIYQYYRQDIVGSRSDIAKVNEHASHLIDEVKKSRLKLNKLSLYSFRRYKNIQIEFDKNLTVVVGENGAGKTSIVESIAKLLSWIAVFVKQVVRFLKLLILCFSLTPRMLLMGLTKPFQRVSSCV